MMRNGGPISVFGTAVRHRHLIWRLALREFEAQFRGSLLGRFWAALGPLLLLGLYTYVFGVVMEARWPGAKTGGTLHVALLYFVGMVLFGFFIECISRAPGLLLENLAYIKKVVFPLEILAWVALVAALLRLFFGAVILILFYVVIDGLPPVSTLALPIVAVPLALVALGLIWFLSALGVYLRDVRQAMTVIAPALMFTSPVFYPMSVVPEPVRTILYANPLSFAIESARHALFDDDWPPLSGFIVYCLLACLFAWLGRLWFMRVRGGFADVV